MKEAKQKSTAIMIIKNTIRKQFVLLVLVIFCSGLLALVTSFTPLVYKTLIDEFIPRKSTAQVFLYVGILILIPIISMGISFFKDRFAYLFSNAISEELRRGAYSACLYMEYNAFEKIGYQKALKVITRETGRVCEFICGELLLVFNSILQMMVAFVMLASINWILALACLSIVPILFLIVNKKKDNVEKLEQRLMQLLRKCDNYLTHSLNGLKTIKAMNAQQYEMKEFDEWLAENKEVNWKIKSAHTFARKVLPNIAQQTAFGILLVICAFFVMRERMTMGALVAAISYIPILFASLDSLLGTRVGYAAIKSAVKSLDEIMEAGKEKGTVSKLDFSALPVEIRNLDFTYGREGFQLKIRDLPVKSGEMLAIVGESGSGKSALFDVLCRFYQFQNGSVRLFGKELNAIEPSVLRSVVRLSAQDSVLWNKSIEENILYPNSLKNKDEMRYQSCIDRAGLRAFLDSLPEGDKTLLGDFGSKVSGGQRQRIAFARALYSDYQILLLDEPTAALDSNCSRQIFDTLFEEKNDGKTVIVVTHDISKAVMADQIMVVKNGEIVESGAPDEVLRQDGYFKKLYDNFQMK